MRMNTQSVSFQVTANLVATAFSWLLALWMLNKRTLLPSELVYSATDFTVMALVFFFVVIGFVYLVQSAQLLRRKNSSNQPNSPHEPVRDDLP